jgi:hypothetical protein
VDPMQAYSMRMSPGWVSNVQTIRFRTGKRLGTSAAIRASALRLFIDWESVCANPQIGMSLLKALSTMVLKSS